MDWLVQSNMTKLGIEVSEQEVENLSGGQRRKLALAKVLAGDFDVLLLDEPTNHLDEGMINWLEEYLKGYKGVLVMVTHDRYFLDKVSNRILEISRGNMYGYDSNYSRFLELKAEREEMELAVSGSVRASFGWNWNGRNADAVPEARNREQDWIDWKP